MAIRALCTTEQGQTSPEFKHGLGNANKDGIWFGPGNGQQKNTQNIGARGTPKVMGVYLSIKNPKETDFMDTQDWIIGLLIVSRSAFEFIF